MNGALESHEILAAVTPTRAPGQPRITEAVLTTVAALLDERGFAGFTIDEVTRRSGVSGQFRGLT